MLEFAWDARRLGIDSEPAVDRVWGDWPAAALTAGEEVWVAILAPFAQPCPEEPTGPRVERIRTGNAVFHAPDPDALLNPLPPDQRRF